MDRGAWRATVRGVAKSQKQLSSHTHAEPHPRFPDFSVQLPTWCHHSFVLWKKKISEWKPSQKQKLLISPQKITLTTEHLISKLMKLPGFQSLRPKLCHQPWLLAFSLSLSKWENLGSPSSIMNPESNHSFHLHSHYSGSWPCIRTSAVASSLVCLPPPKVCFPLCNQMKPGSKVISLLCSKFALLPQQMPNFTGNHITRMTPLPLHSVPKRKTCALFPACGHPTKHLHMLVGVPEIIFYTFSHWWQKEQFLQKILCPGLRMSLDDFSQVPRPKGWGNGRQSPRTPQSQVLWMRSKPVGAWDTLDFSV